MTPDSQLLNVPQAQSYNRFQSLWSVQRLEQDSQNCMDTNDAFSHLAPTLDFSEVASEVADPRLDL